MGYTHYWRNVNQVPEADYQAALADIRKVIAASPIPLFDGDGEGEANVTDGIGFNGDAGRGEDHESFTLAATASGNRDFKFCKTARRPYDLMVVASLAILADKTNAQVSSDGDAKDWNAGVRLASKVLGRIIRVPKTVRRPA